MLSCEIYPLFVIFCITNMLRSNHSFILLCTIHTTDQANTPGRTLFSCTPDREIQRFTPCEKFLSHPRYLTPVAPCVQVFFYNIGCIGRHVISSLSAHVTMTSKRFKSKWRTPRFYNFSR